MTCPYCNHKNLPHAVICNQCGIILRLGKTTSLVPHGSAGGGAMAYMKTMLTVNRLRSQHGHLQGRLQHVLTEAQQEGEAQIEDPARAPQARLNLAAAHLLADEIEKSVHWFQQAQQLGASGPEFWNNAAVALAQRGSLTQAADLFNRAAGAKDAPVQSRANLAHVFVRAGVDPDPEAAAQALKEIQAALAQSGTNPAYYNQLGLILCREHRYAEAFAQFRQALERAGSPARQADAHNNRGMACFQSDDLDGAGQEFAEAVRLDPGHARALSNQGVLLLAAGDVGNANEKLQKAAHIDPQDAGAHGNSGCGLCRAGAINDGILELKQAVDLDLHFFEAYYNLGKAYADENIQGVADRYLSRALTLRPRSWETLTALGALKTRQNLLPQALGYLKTAAQINFRHPLSQTNLAVVLALSGERGEALERYKQAAKVDAQNAVIPAQMGWLNLLRENLSAADDELQIALKLDDGLPEAHNNYGLCQMGLGHPETALLHFRRTLDLNSDLGTVHYHIGCVYAHLTQFDPALKEFELAAKSEPSNPDCHANRGVAFYKKGMMDEAVAEFKLVIVMRQNRMEDYSNLGLAYARQGVALKKSSRNPEDPRAKESLEKHRQAIAMFDKGLELDPKNVMLHSNRGLACYFSSRAEAAMQAWATVSKLNPLYAQKRGKAQQTEFDETQVAFVPIDIPKRALPIMPRTGEYLHRLLPGYDTDEWELVLSDPALAPVPEMRREARQLERHLHALQS